EFTCRFAKLWRSISYRVTLRSISSKRTTPRSLSTSSLPVISTRLRLTVQSCCPGSICMVSFGGEPSGSPKDGVRLGSSSSVVGRTGRINALLLGSTVSRTSVGDGHTTGQYDDETDTLRRCPAGND